MQVVLDHLEILVTPELAVMVVMQGLAQQMLIIHLSVHQILGQDHLLLLVGQAKLAEIQHRQYTTGRYQILQVVQTM
jgi:hypothetical protein